jgi:hypothetical protein
MRVCFSSSCAIGLAIALVLGSAPTARGQQQEPRRTTSSRRIPVTKDRPTRPAPTAAPAASRVNQDSIVAAERARQDSIAAAERARQEAVAAADRDRRDQMRRDSITIAERQDSIAAAEQARQDSIARAHNRARSSEALRIARQRNSGFYMAIAGGSTMPMGDLKTKTTNSYDAGWNVTVPFGWDFSGFPLGLRFDLAMDNLTAKGNFLDSGGNPVLGRNVAIFSGSGGLKLNVPIFRTTSRFYLIGGAGAHRITGYATSASGTDSAQTIQNAKTNVGWYGGAGLNFRFGKTALFVESRYINIDTKQPPVGFAYQKANYLPVILGFQF